MSQLSNIDKDYLNWVSEIKSKIRSTQIRAVLAANATLIEFYYDLGRMIVEKQAQSAWGDKLIQQLSKDLQAEFPEMSGFSRTNLLYCKQFFLYFQISQQTVGQIVPQVGGQLQNTDSQESIIVPQVGGQLSPEDGEKLRNLVFNIPWGHIKVILGRVKDPQTALFYLQETQKNAWSRDVLALQIKNQLHKRQGKAVTNFSLTLPEPMSDLAQQTLKDPYIFDFLILSKPYREKDIENQLIQHIAKFLLELGKGFAFVGQQYHLEIADSDYYLDLLFYHIQLKCYVVIELKNAKFIPEHAGKLNFYLSAVDTLLKKDDDKPTIGILLCRDKNNIEAEFALRDIHKPMGVSEFELTTVLPEELKSSLPTIEELEQSIK
ncbi:MAG: PDDEXK nuclease domain-containing protein [Candidatus Azobacteroides sp.]|nr:PDDEXK nuclease domain-containing protein [Candidatus Azobacteroides sp.]